MIHGEQPPPPTRRDTLDQLDGPTPLSTMAHAPDGPRRWRFHRSRSSHILHALGDWSARASAGVMVAAALATWGVVGLLTGFPHWWEVALYSTTSAVTVVMLFAVQHSQHRQQVVTQRKLDELLRAQPGADDLMIAAEAAGDAELAGLVDMRPDDPRTQALAAALGAEDRAV